MKDEKVLQEVFSSITEQPIGIKESSAGKFEYLIKTKYKMILFVTFESNDNFFNIDINYPNRDTYSLSSYEFYKEYDKKKTKKKMFAKKTIVDHLNTLVQYVQDNLAVLCEEDTAKVYFSTKTRGYGKLFVE